MPSVNSDIRFSDMHSSFWDLYCFVARFVPILHSVDCYIFIVILFLYNTSIFKNYFFLLLLFALCLHHHADFLELQRAGTALCGCVGFSLQWMLLWSRGFSARVQ